MMFGINSKGELGGKLAMVQLLPSFWLDDRSEMDIPLIDHIVVYEGFIDKNEFAADYYRANGEWDRDKLGCWFGLHHMLLTV